MKKCTMNCGPAAGDTRSDEQRKADCTDCVDVTTVLYIAPASGETYHPQARIYSCVFDSGSLMDSALAVRDMYRLNPQAWVEVGLINYQGKLVCFEGSSTQLWALKDTEPLAAGLVFTFKGVQERHTAFRSMHGTQTNLQNMPNEKPVPNDVPPPNKRLSGSEYHKTLCAMQRFGGGFAWNLASAGFVADTHNQHRLEAAFPDLFSKYGPGTDFYKATQEN
jgi:hypothetical protein